MLCSQAKEHAEEQAKQKGEQMRNLKISLWRALWTGFGWPYISLGLLKLFSDALNFAGKHFAQVPLQSDSVHILQSDVRAKPVVFGPTYCNSSHQLLCRCRSQCGLLGNAILGFLSTMLSYAGPLLLNALLKFLGQGRSHGHHNERPLEQPQSQDMHSALRSFLNRDSAAYGCCLVALLGLTAVLKVRSVDTICSDGRVWEVPCQARGVKMHASQSRAGVASDRWSEHAHGALNM